MDNQSQPDLLMVAMICIGVSVLAAVVIRNLAMDGVWFK